MITQDEVDALVATTRRQVDTIQRLRLEADHRESDFDALAARLAEARRHVSVLQALLAVIHIFTKLPMPSPESDNWQKFYIRAVKRCEQVSWMANETGPATSTIHDAERCRELIEAWDRAGLDYEPEPGALPKPAADLTIGRTAPESDAVLTITDTAMTSDKTRHTAAAIPTALVPRLARSAEGEHQQFWSVTWLPGQSLTRDQAITAMTLAEFVAITPDLGSKNHKAWVCINGWADELGMTGAAAVTAVEGEGKSA